MTWKNRLKKTLILVAIAIPVILAVLVLAINTFDWNYARPLISRVVTAFSPYTLDINGDIDLHLGRELRVETRDLVVRAKNYPDGAAPLFEAKRFFIAAPVTKLWGHTVEVNGLELESGRVFLLRDSDGKLRFLPPPSTAPKSPEPKESWPVPILRGLHIADLRMTYEDQSLEETATVEVDRIRTMAGGGLEPIHIQGKGTLQQQPFALKATWEQGTEKEEGVSQIAMVLTLGKNQLASTGNVIWKTEGFERADFKIDAGISDPALIFRLVGYPASRPVGFDLAANASIGKENFSVKKFRWETARSIVTGEMNARLQNRKPHVVADVLVQELNYSDIESYLPPKKKAEVPAEKKGPVFSRKPLDNDFLRQMNAHVKFQLRKFRAGNYLQALKAAKGELRMQEGATSLTLSDVTVAGGKMQMFSTLLPRGETALEMKTTGNFQNLDIQALARPLVNKMKDINLPTEELLGGRLSGKLSLRTSGNSMHALASELDGNVTLALENGQLNAALLQLLNFDIPEAAEAWVANATGTKVSCILVHVPVKDGVLRSEAFFVNTPVGELLGDGYVDLGQEKFDIRVAAKADGRGEGGVAVPIHLTGTLSNPTLDVRTENGLFETVKKSLKGALPFGRQKGIEVAQTDRDSGCAQELRNRYLPTESTAH